MTLTEEMRRYINLINEAKVDRNDARKVLAKLSPTYAKVRKDDKLQEVSINKGAIKAIGMAMAFVAVSVGGINASMIGPVPVKQAQEISQSIAQDLKSSYDSMPNGVVSNGAIYSEDDWQIDIKPVDSSSGEQIGSDSKGPPSEIKSEISAELEAKIKERMEQRIAEMEALGVKVEHNHHAERHDQVPASYTADYGPWEGRPGYANVPNRPTIVNYFVMEEEFAHALGSDEAMYGRDPVHMLWEEFRAKHYAKLKVEEVFELDAAAQAQNEMTNQNYIQFARDMAQYTRQNYTDEIIAEIRADAEATAEYQYRTGKMTVGNSGEKFVKYFAR